MRAKTVNFERGKDPKESMNIGLKAQRWNEMKDLDIDGLITYLDERYPHLDKYRNPKAMYDDAFFEDVPLSELEKVGITEELLFHILDENTGDYAGWLSVENNPPPRGPKYVTIGGEA